MRGWIATAIAAATIASSLLVAHGDGPGPNGHNNAGLCNAYFRGSQTGQDEKQAHGTAFVALAATATAWDAADDGTTGGDDGVNGDSSESTQEKVAEYCAANS